MIVAALVVFLSLTQAQTPCTDVTSCQTMAESARQAQDYESFHDLAWAAYRQGKSNDAELMLLVARAQSLSGRPGDALVMLERVAALGHVGDALTSEDFARVRALPRWPEVAEKLAGAPATPDLTASAKAAESSPERSARAKKEAAAAHAMPAKPPDTTASKTIEKPPVPPGEKTAVKPPDKRADKPAEKSAGTPAGTLPEKPADKPAEKTAAKEAAAPKRDPNAPLPFTTLLSPDALAYDAVSRRFIIADRKARRVAVIDEHTGQVATLVGAQGALGEISGITIDPQQGDLWVISMSEDGPSLHRMQLISGRMLSTVPLSIEDAVTAMAWVPGSGLVVADSNGIVWGVRPDGRSQKLAALEYVPRGFAADARGRLYVAAGTSRLARFAVNATLRKIDTIELERSIPADAPFVVSGNRLHVIVPAQGNFEVRSVPVK